MTHTSKAVLGKSDMRQLLVQADVLLIEKIISGEYHEPTYFFGGSGKINLR